VTKTNSNEVAPMSTESIEAETDPVSMIENVEEQTQGGREEVDGNILNDDTILAWIVKESHVVQGQPNPVIYWKKENGRIVFLSFGALTLQDYRFIM
jgi:hypothetical protein